MDHEQTNAERVVKNHADRIAALERELARLANTVDRLVRKAGKL